MNHFNIIFFENRQPLGRIVASGFNHFDATVNNRLNQTGVIRRRHRGQKGQVNAKGLVGHGATASNFIGQFFWGTLGQASDNAETAGIGDGSG